MLNRIGVSSSLDTKCFFSLFNTVNRFCLKPIGKWLKEKERQKSYNRAEPDMHIETVIFFPYSSLFSCAGRSLSVGVCIL